MNISECLIEKAKKCVNHLKTEGKKVSLAESCTGGLLSFLISSIPGASCVLECSVVTYSNAAKELLLNIERENLQKYGAVSHETAASMAEGLIKLAKYADLAIAVTGTAGRILGGSRNTHNDKDSGTVFIGHLKRDLTPQVSQFHFCHSLTRFEIQQKAVESALDIILETQWQ